MKIFQIAGHEACVYLFEPLPNIAAALPQNITGRFQVTITAATLGNEDGKITFNRIANSLASSALILSNASELRFFCLRL